MSNLLTPKRHMLSAAIATLIVSTGAVAQEQEIEEVLVMGSGQIRSSQTLTSDVIRKIAPMMNPINLIDRLPGVNIGSGDAFGGDDWTSTLEIRGFNGDQIGYTVDGIPLGASFYGGGTKPSRYVDTENIQAVTVTQGAADTGTPSAQSLAGSISYETRGAEKEAGVQVSYTGGDDNMNRYFMRLDSGAILGGNTYVYISGSDTKYDHWMDYGAKAVYDRSHGEVGITHELGGDNTIEFRYSNNDKDSNNYDDVTVEAWKQNKWDDGIHNAWSGNPLTDGYNAEGWGDPREDEMYSLKGHFVLANEIELNITAYKHEQDGSGYWPWECHRDSGDLLTLLSSDDTVCDRDENGVAGVATMYISFYGNDRRGLTFNLTKMFGEHEVSVGAWSEDQDRFYFRTYHHVIDPKNGPAWDSKPYYLESDRDFKTDSSMAFIQDKFSLLDDRLHVVAGITAQTTEIDYTDNRYGESNDYDADYTYAPRLGGVYDLSDRTELFASYSRNFKNMQDNILVSYDVSDVDTELADSIDVGIRYNNDWVNLSLTAYQIEFDNKIATISYTTAPEDSGTRAYSASGVVVNAGAQEAMGIELASEFRLSDSFKLYVSASWSEAENISISNPVTDDRGIVISSDFESVERTDKSLFTELSYTVADLRVAISAAYEDERDGNLTGGTPAPDYWLWGASAGYTLNVGDNDIDFSLNVHNLLDEAYLSGVATQGQFYVGAPRTITLSVGTSF